MTAVCIELLHHRDRTTAEFIHAIQMAAYAQEADLLGARHFPSLERTVDDIQAANERFIGALDGTLIIGALSTATDEEVGAINVTSLVVAPHRQRQGIGRQLLAFAIANCDDTDFTVSTGIRNGPSMALYSEFGFVECKRWFVGAEPLELVKLLRSASNRDVER